MFRVAAALIAAAFVSALSLAPAAQAGSLTRIEPRPYYGATVTIEAGVRVFRPLPPTRHMIINPGHRTPVNIIIKDVRERRTFRGEFNHNYYNHGGGYGGYAAGLPYGTYGGHGGRKRNGQRRYGRSPDYYVRRAPRFRGHRGAKGRRGHAGYRGGRSRGGRGGKH